MIARLTQSLLALFWSATAALWWSWSWGFSAALAGTLSLLLLSLLWAQEVQDEVFLELERTQAPRKPRVYPPYDN